MKRVLFVCIENSCRSQMAEAFVKLYGKGVLEPFSASSRPSGTINIRAIMSMAMAGYDYLGSHKSKSLEEIPTHEYDFAITMGCGDASSYVKAKERRDWSIPDPKDMKANQFNEVRNLIKEKVLALIEEVKEKEEYYPNV